MGFAGFAGFAILIESVVVVVASPLQRFAQIKIAPTIATMISRVIAPAARRSSSL